MNLIKLTKQNHRQVVDLATRAIKNGGIVAAPFDTVYGFMADASNDQAISKIFELKERDLNKSIGVAIGAIDSIANYAEIKNSDFIEKHTPGRYTFILPVKNKILSQFCYKDDTLALRIPDSPLILEICTAVDQPIAQTSANKAGQIASSSLGDFLAQFKEKELSEINLIIDGGEISNPAPSEIWDLTKDSPKKIER